MALAQVGLVLTPGVGVIVWAFVLGFAAALAFIVVLTLPPRLAAPGDVHRMSAAIFTMQYATAFVLPLIAGALWDATGRSRGWRSCRAWPGRWPDGLARFAPSGSPDSLRSVLGEDSGLVVAQDLAGRPRTLLGPAFHEALEVGRAVLAGEVAFAGVGRPAGGHLRSR